MRSRKKKKTKCKQSCIWFYLYIQYKRNKPNRTKPNRNEACNNSLADFKNFIAYVDVVDSIVVTAVLSLSTLFPLAFPLNKTHTRRVANQTLNKQNENAWKFFFVSVLITHTLLAHQCPILTGTSIVCKNDSRPFTSFFCYSFATTATAITVIAITSVLFKFKWL